MTVRRDGQTIHLEGDCRIEEAETLTGLLTGPGPWTIDLTLCRHLHGAVVQALLWFRPAIGGNPETPFMRDVLGPALKTERTEPRMSLPE